MSDPIDETFARSAAPARWRVVLSGPAAMAICSVGVVACSGGNYSAESPLDYLEPAAVQSGVFKPGRVSGLDFVSGVENGVTDAAGRFTCTTGQPVRFSLGSLELGATDCATLAHPAALSSGGLLTDARTLNTVRLLLFLDEDQSPDNGVVIPAALRTLADSWAPIDLSAADFESEVGQVVADTASVESRSEYVLPTNAQAYAYLDTSLACAYSGVFVNYVAGGAFDALTTIALSTSRDPVDGDDEFYVQIQRNHPQSQFYLAHNGLVELRALPLLGDENDSGSGNVFGQFATPDRVAGQWVNAVTIQPLDANGSFTLVRIGGGDGEYRFTGTYRRAPGLDGPTPPVGHVALVLDGDTITGDAFEIASGLILRVTGRLLPGGNRVELVIGAFGATAEADLLYDPDRALIGIDGAWPGLTNGIVSAVGCRL